MWRLFRYGWRYRGRLALMLATTLTLAGLAAVMLMAANELLGLLGVDRGAAHAAKATGWLAKLDLHLPGTRSGDRDADLVGLGAWLAGLAPVAAIAAYLAWVSGQWLANRCM